MENYKTKVLPIQFSYKGKTYSGEARPLSESCRDGVCFELRVILNGKDMGLIHCTKDGWEMDEITDHALVEAIGEEIFLYYE